MSSALIAPADRPSAMLPAVCGLAHRVAAWCGPALRRRGRPQKTVRLGLRCFRRKVRLSGPEATQRLVVLAITPDGKTNDRSADARLESLQA